jgi:hypothetical protein
MTVLARKQSKVSIDGSPLDRPVTTEPAPSTEFEFDCVVDQKLQSLCGKWRINHGPSLSLRDL